MAKTNDAGVILDTATDVTLAGKTYKMRRLSTRDVFTFAKMMGQIMGKVEMNASETEEMFGAKMMAQFLGATEEMAGFYGSLIGLTEDEFLGLPPIAFSEFIEQFAEQQDVAAFFAAVLKALGAMGQLWQNA